MTLIACRKCGSGDVVKPVAVLVTFGRADETDDHFDRTDNEGNGGEETEDYNRGVHGLNLP